MIFGVVVKLVITPACHAGGRGFKSHRPRQKIKGSQPQPAPLFWLSGNAQKECPTASQEEKKNKLPENRVRILCFGEVDAKASWTQTLY